MKEIGVSRTLALTGHFPLTTLLWQTLLLDAPFSLTLLLGDALVVGGYSSFRAATLRRAALAPALGYYPIYHCSLMLGLLRYVAQAGDHTYEHNKRTLFVCR